MNRDHTIVQDEHMTDSLKEVVFGERLLAIEDIINIAHKHTPVSLYKNKNYIKRIKQGQALLEKLLREGNTIYGVTTGYGDSCTTNIPAAQIKELPLHLTRFHGCGLGAYFSPQMSRAILAVRLASLARGSSGVRWELLQRLVDFLNADIAPVIPEEGSVGASGDLTPLSYVAALLIGERQAYFHGEICEAELIHNKLNLQPLTLKLKEGLAIMNGTSVMTALACEALHRAEYLTRLTTRLTALTSMALGKNPNHFSEELFKAKPHPGQAEIAQWLRHDLHENNASSHERDEAIRLQDRYSIRCAPHIIGVLRDSLFWMRQFIEIEINSANDNPIIDIDNEKILHGGNFYGGHIAFAMDSLKICVANLADLMDRQLALLVDIKFNNGLSANLSGAKPERAAINHGFKAVQIGASAWTAEALKLTMPASVFSRSTECHNQDKVSMGSIAARDALRVLQLTEQVAAAHTLATYQAYVLRQGLQTNQAALTQNVQGFLDDISQNFSIVEEDRPLEKELRDFVALIQNQHWNLY